MVRVDARRMADSTKNPSEPATETFQIPLEAAEAYETHFVPAFFAEWAPHLCDIAGVGAGQSVLDVGCGTGIVARTAAERVGPHGTVVGLDCNEAMLTVARRLRPDLEWHQGDAAALPFPDASFDTVVSQAAMMFFPNPAVALREMDRVAVPGGTVAVQVWSTLEASAGYSRFAEVLARRAGPEAAAFFDAYWVLGDLGEVVSLVERAGLEVISTRTRTGHVRFGSIDQFIATEIQSTPLAERLDDDTYQEIRDDAQVALRPFLTESGGVALPIEGHLVAARRPS
jgi:SAM-dependent methyltransferase